MKVAFLNRPPADPAGGDRISTVCKMEALARLGIECELLHGDGLARLPEFDLAHLIHIDFEFCIPNLKALANSDVPYVVTPIFYPEFADTWVPRMTKEQVLRRAKAIIPFSKREGDDLRGVFGDWLTYTPVPNGTDPAFRFPNADESRVGVCSVDAWGWKQWQLIDAACKLVGLSHDLYRKTSYEEMPAEYRKHRVFVSASKSDRMSLAVGEALCAGCRCLVSTANRGNEWYPGLRTFNPNITPTALSRLIRDAHDAPDWDYSPNDAARTLTWDFRSQQIKQIYESILN